MTRFSVQTVLCGHFQSECVGPAMLASPALLKFDMCPLFRPQKEALSTLKGGPSAIGGPGGSRQLI